MASSGAPLDAIVRFPGGIRLRVLWAGSGKASEVFALSEAGGPILDLGSEVSAVPDELCRAELRAETPGGSWTVRLASTIHDEPTAYLWDTEGLLVVAYGFHTWGLTARTGERRWSHRSGSPIVALLGSPRLDHVLVQAEVETFAIRADGEVAWRLGHSDVVTAAELVGGRLVLASYGGQLTAIDPATGRPAG